MGDCMYFRVLCAADDDHFDVDDDAETWRRAPDRTNELNTPRDVTSASAPASASSIALQSIKSRHPAVTKFPHRCRRSRWTKNIPRAGKL